MNLKKELLSPAGSFESLKAAIQNGANAVYLGGMRFGARAYAANFTSEDLVKAVRYAHIRGVKIYVTANIIVFDNEVLSFIEYIDFLYHADVDAVILQDIGMAYIINELYPDFAMHASTQMTTTNHRDALYLKSIGFERIVAARENSLEEIDKIFKKTGIEIEDFVHGALCMSYSGKCLFGYMSLGRSGNRGTCSQPCRMFYKLKQKSGYLLSSKDLSALPYIDKIKSSAILSLKIEGRMKRPEYVATVTSAYRRALDLSLNKNTLLKAEDEIKHIFQREYTKGFLLSENNENIVNNKTPKNTGVVCGVVVFRNKNKIKIKLEDDLTVGDGLSLGEKVGRIFLNNREVSESHKGDEVMLDYVGDAKVGDVVYKTYDKTIMEKAVKSYEKENILFEINCVLNAKIGQNPSITLYDEAYTSKITLDDVFVQKAASKPIDYEIVYNQISKLNDSVYRLKDLELDIDADAFLSKSTLNLLRRKAVSKLDNLRSVRHGRVSCKGIQNSVYYNLINGAEIKRENRFPYFIARCNTEEQIKAVSKLKFDRVEIYDPKMYEYSLEYFDETSVYLSLPVIISEDDLEIVDKFMLKFKNKVVCNSLGILNGAEDAEGDYGLNFSNAVSLSVHSSHNVTPSLEWVFGNFYGSLYTYPDKSHVIIPVYLKPQIMTTKYRLTDFEDTLISLKNEKYSVLNDILNKNRIYNDEILELKDKICEFYNAGFYKFRFEFLYENEEMIVNTVNEYKKVLKDGFKNTQGVGIRQD